MRVTERVGRIGRTVTVLTVSAGTAFQISSCNIDESGAISAFANPTALSDLRTQLFEASPIGQLLDDFHGSVEINVGDGE